MPKPKRPKAHKQPIILSPQQQRLLLDTFSQEENLRDTMLILLVLKTGLKSGEACRLNVSDVLKSSVAEFPKSCDFGYIQADTLKVRVEIAANKSPRQLPLNEEIQNAINDFIKWKQYRGESLEPNAPLFCTMQTKKRLVPRDIQRLMEKASAILGERITANDLRHTFASELYQKTGNLETVRDALGLASLKGAQVYAQVERMPNVGKESDVKSLISDMDTACIEGTLLMLDDITPHVAVVVQAVIPASGAEGEPSVVSTTLTNETGKYQLTGLKPRQYQVRCYTLKGYVYYQNGDILNVEHGQTLKHIDFRIAPFKKGTWKNYSTLDGLGANSIWAMYRDRDGAIWFGTYGGGVSRYDGKTFVNFTTKDGLLPGPKHSIYRDDDGVMWFGSWANLGFSRYDGVGFVNFTIADGLPHNWAWMLHGDTDGRL